MRREDKFDIKQLKNFQATLKGALKVLKEFDACEEKGSNIRSIILEDINIIVPTIKYKKIPSIQNGNTEIKKYCSNARKPGFITVGKPIETVEKHTFADMLNLSPQNWTKEMWKTKEGGPSTQFLK